MNLSFDVFAAASYPGTAEEGDWKLAVCSGVIVQHQMIEPGVGFFVMCVVPSPTLGLHWQRRGVYSAAWPWSLEHSTGSAGLLLVCLSAAYEAGEAFRRPARCSGTLGDAFLKQ